MEQEKMKFQYHAINETQETEGYAKSKVEAMQKIRKAIKYSPKTTEIEIIKVED